MQRMTITCVVPCHALHALQHAAASPFESLNHSYDFLRPSCRSRLCTTGSGKSRYAGFCLALPTLRLIADQGLIAYEYIHLIHKPSSQSAFYVNLYRAVIGPSG